MSIISVTIHSVPGAVIQVSQVDSFFSLEPGEAKDRFDQSGLWFTTRAGVYQS